MRNILIIMSLFLGLGINTVQAQFADRLVPHMGFMYEIATIDQGNGPETLTAFYNFHIGTYYTIAHYNDIFSVGIDPSLQFGLNFVPVFNGNSQFTRVNYVIQAPVFLMGKIGATATAYNQQKVGIAAGIGGNFTYFSQQILDNINLRRSTSYINPSVVVEATIVQRGNPLTGRFHFALARTNSELNFKDVNTKDIVSTITLPMGNFGLGLIYGF